VDVFGAEGEVDGVAFAQALPAVDAGADEGVADMKVGDDA